MAEKETDKGLMHSFFGEELCHGCKGMLVVAFIAPSQKDISSFAEAFSRIQKAVDAQGANVAQGAISMRDAPNAPAKSSFVKSPGTRKNKKKK